MLSLDEYLIFVGAAFLMVLTPGANMIYIISRSLSQGREAGVISLFGVVAGFFVHLIGAAIGLTTFFLSVPCGLEIIQWAGIVYFSWLAWQTVKPNVRSSFHIKKLSMDSPRKLLMIGFLTSVFNPKVALFYLAVLPQFISQQKVSILAQIFILGLTQIIISFLVNFVIALSAVQIATRLPSRPIWFSIQRYVMGFVFSALAVGLSIKSVDVVI